MSSRGRAVYGLGEDLLDYIEGESGQQGFQCLIRNELFSCMDVRLHDLVMSRNSWAQDAEVVWSSRSPC